MSNDSKGIECLEQFRFLYVAVSLIAVFRNLEIKLSQSRVASRNFHVFSVVRSLFIMTIALSYGSLLTPYLHINVWETDLVLSNIFLKTSI